MFIKSCSFVSAVLKIYFLQTEKLKKSLEAEIVSLRERVSELENDCVSKSKEVVNAVTGKEEALDAALAEISNLKEDISLKT